jgi:hypothetical protein
MASTVLALSRSDESTVGRPGYPPLVGDQPDAAARPDQAPDPRYGRP